MTPGRPLLGLGLGTAVLAALAPALAAPHAPLSDGERRLRERTTDVALERRVDDLLARLTLEETIGQMAMVNVVEDVPDESRRYPPGFPTVSPARLDQLFGRYPVGCIVPYDHKPSEASAAGPAARSTIADYGSGLSYTTFAYQDLALSRGSATRGRRRGAERGGCSGPGLVPRPRGGDATPGREVTGPPRPRPPRTAPR